MHTWQDTTLPLDARVDALLEAMGLEDLAGQLGSFWHDAAPIPTGDGGTEHHDVAPMEEEQTRGKPTWEQAHAHGLGHLTRVFGTEPVTVKEGTTRLRERQSQVVAASAFGIPAIAHEECLTGLTTLGATVYPAPMAWASTWRPELVHDMAQAIGDDMRALGVHQGLSPLLDVVRDYRGAVSRRPAAKTPISSARRARLTCRASSRPGCSPRASTSSPTRPAGPVATTRRFRWVVANSRT